MGTGGVESNYVLIQRDSKTIRKRQITKLISSLAKHTFFSAMIRGSFFVRNGATRGVVDKKSNQVRI